jgi:flagellar motor switch protein FliN/FliY
MSEPRERKSGESTSVRVPPDAEMGAEGEATARDREGEFHYLRAVPLELTVELGRTKLTLGEVLELTPGEVVQLDKAAGEALDLRVNGVLFARGEAVLVNDRYGIRIRSLVDRDQVISSLRTGER